MEQGDTTVWINWIRKETEAVMNQLDEESDARSDPDDPFNGTANGVFLPLQDPLALPPPVQMPRRNENNSECRETFQNLWESIRKLDTVDRDKTKNKKVTPMQGGPCEFREHSRELLDLMRSIRNLHTQQRQNWRNVQEMNQNSPPASQRPQINVNQQELNLITFTPAEQQVPPT